jgi:outer membrane beta-barrel protein
MKSLGKLSMDLTVFEAGINNLSGLMPPSTTDGKMQSTQTTLEKPPTSRRSLVLKLSIVAFAVVWLSLIAASWADAGEKAERASLNREITQAQTDAASEQGADRSPAGVGRAPSSASSGDDEYNFNWLDPEKKIYVLQNRRYQKAGHLLLSAMVGPGFSNPYRTTYNLDPRVGYFLSESWGFEGFYTFTTNSENGTYGALRAASSSALPVVREIRSQYGANLIWVPWYAKINVFNKILYFDWYFTGGAGNIHSQLDTRASASSAPAYLDQDLFSFFFGTGHIYHLSDMFQVRLDFTSAIYRAPVFGTSGENSWYSNYNFAIGLGLRI